MLRSVLLGHFFCLCPHLQHLVQTLWCSIYAISSSWDGVHASSSLAPRLGPFLGVSGSGRCFGDGVLGCCSSDPKKVVGGDAVAADIGAGVAIGAATVKSPEGAEIDLATVAGMAAAADFVADADVELEASVFSVEPGETFDPFSCFFWDLSDPPIFWRGFAVSPTF